MAPHAAPAAPATPAVYPTPQLRTYFGRTFWPAPLFKTWWPFLFTGTALVFMNIGLVTAMENDPYDKWNRQVAIVNADTIKGKQKGEATAWYLEQRKKAEAPVEAKH